MGPVAERRGMRSVLTVAATTFEWLPSEVDLSFVGTTALIVATLALLLVWPRRLLQRTSWFRREGVTPRSARFGAMATLSSGAAGLGAMLGLVFVIAGVLSA